MSGVKRLALSQAQKKGGNFKASYESEAKKKQGSKKK